MQERYTVPVPRAARVRGRAVPGVRQPELRRAEGEGGDGHAHQERNSIALPKLSCKLSCKLGCIFWVS